MKILSIFTDGHFGHRTELAKHAARALLGFDILGSWGGLRDKRGGKLCLFSQWDRHGVIDDYVLHYLSRLSDHGFSIDLVSTSSHLEPESLRAALRICDRVILRRNIGLDFGSWVDAVRSPGRLAGHERLLLANDSVFGPFHDFGPTFARMEEGESSLWGMTDNDEHAYHLQSYFLVMPRATLRSKAFRSFWRRILPRTNKEEIIHHYEIGISRSLLRAGGSVRAAFPSEQILGHARSMGDDFQYREELDSRKPLNVSLYAWDVLLRDFRAPLIKTDVFKRDLYRCRSLVHWPDMVPAESRHLVEVITRHLRRAHPDAEALKYV